MGGGDLNMKKSWHPLLLKNQERVWLEEKKALEEKKKLDQLRKEKEEERQLQELQRMQEEQTGKKRTEKLEWMYTTPATGTGQNANDLEDYLLGKKRVDKILTADDNAKLGASHKSFIAVQNANNVRDVAAKIREDPLFAIKQQEQAAYEALMANPLRLREMQERNGIKPKKDKKAKKEEKKRLKEEKRKALEYEHHSRRRSSRSLSPRRDHHHRHLSRRSPSPYSSRSRSPPPRRYDDHRRHSHGYADNKWAGRSRSRSPSPLPPSRSRHDTAPRTSSRSEDSDEQEYRRRDRDSVSGKRRRSPSPPRDLEPYHKRSRRPSPPPPPPRHHDSSNSNRSTQQSQRPADDRAARLAAMSSNAVSMSVERQERLTKMLELEKREMEEDEKARRESKGMGEFLSAEAKKVYGGIGLEERIRRGKGGLVREAD